MPSTTQIPALAANVKGRKFYVATMTYAQVKQQIGFAYEEIEANRDLKEMLQREIRSRTRTITDYILHNDQHFLGTLLIGVWGGNPQFKIVSMTDSNELMPNLDEGMGFLVLDGSQVFFALDGQHRLRAIKDAVEQDPGLGKEQIAVVFVGHEPTKEGRQRTRRLFTNINRRAKPTQKAENIALDEDDGCAIVTRRLIDDHEWLSREGVVRIFTATSADDRQPRLAPANIPKSDHRAWTTMSTLYEIVRGLGFDLDPSMLADPNEAIRPNDAVLDESQRVLSGRIDDLLAACGGLRDRLDATADASELRAPDGDEGRGHAFMRPVVQRYLSETLGAVCGPNRVNSLAWGDALETLRGMDWEIASPPWRAVYNPGPPSRMMTNRDHSELLKRLLAAHLAPETKRQIADARREYKDLIGADYPVSADALAARLAAGGDAA